MWFKVEEKNNASAYGYENVLLVNSIHTHSSK